jgi:hypothetical protein
MPRLAAALLLTALTIAPLAITPTFGRAQDLPRPAITTLTPAPSAMLWIGNSFFYFNNGLPAHVAGFVAAARRPAIRANMVTISGAGFDWHDVASYFRPNAVGRYTFDADNVIHFTPPGPIYDSAVLMDCSQCPLHPELKESFWTTGRRHAETVRAAGARPIFFMSWAYADHPEMTAGLAAAYTRLGNETGALVIPAGLAFARARGLQPDVQLYIADKRHPTLAGSYLAAAVSYAALFGTSPVDLPYTAGLEPELAAFLQRVAWETVQGYFRSP